MRITADTGRCVGSGMCALTAPEIFDQNAEDGTVVLLQHEPPDNRETLVGRAIQLCPAGALVIETIEAN